MNHPDRLALAEQFIHDAVGHLVIAAEELSREPSVRKGDVADELKTVATYLRHQAASVHALQAALMPNDTEALERALGAEPGWAGA